MCVFKLGGPRVAIVITEQPSIDIEGNITRLCETIWGEVTAGDKKMQVVSLSVNPSGENYSIEISVNGRKKTLKGKYIARSAELNPPGLIIRPVPANPQLISVTCRDRTFCGVPFRDTLYRTQ